MSFHPGANGEYSVVRYTAPSAGQFVLNAAFTGIDTTSDPHGPTSTDVHILHNGSQLFGAVVNDYQNAHAFSSTLSLSTGDTLDFVVGVGPDGNYYDDTTALAASVIAEFTPVIQIKPPATAPVPINQSSAGVIPVAILSSSTFDATQVDPASVSLAGARVKLIGKSDKYSCNAQDVNGDGLDDLVCQVSTAQFMVEPGDSTAVLEATTNSGQPIHGEEAITIVP